MKKICCVVVFIIGLVLIGGGVYGISYVDDKKDMSQDIAGWVVPATNASLGAGAIFILPVFFVFFGGDKEIYISRFRRPKVKA